MPKGDFLGEFEIYVMLAVEQLAPEAYGLAIRQEITRRSGREVAIGAVYATLSRLEEKKLVRYAMSEPQPVRGGRTRKHFSLTPAGQRALAHSMRMLARMMQGWKPRTQQ